MTGTQKAITFLNYLGIGLFVPILSLFLLSHGCDLQSLAILIGIYSATVILAEVPSGMLADICGQKSAFFLSCFFVAASFILMYFSRSFLLLIAGMVLFGLGRAFLSGSLDSLIIQDCMRRNGDAALSQAVGANLVYQCGGIAAGSLLGGFLPNVVGYSLHIIARLAILATVAVLCGLFLKEAPVSKKIRKTFKDQTHMVAATLKGNRLLLNVMLCIFGSSIAMFALETYWQPQFTPLISQQRHYLLGIVSAGGYGGNMLGSFLISRVRMPDQKSRWRFYLVFITLFGLGLCLLAVQGCAIGFMVCYILIMTVLGFANVPEQTLLNSMATDETRASLLSMASLFAQIAGILSSTICALLVVSVGITGVMLGMGGLSVGVAIVVAMIVLKQFMGKDA